MSDAAKLRKKCIKAYRGHDMIPYFYAFFLKKTSRRKLRLRNRHAFWKGNVMNSVVEGTSGNLYTQFRTTSGSLNH